MTFVVTEACIKCKLTDCVEVCPVDCFHEGPNFLVIDPDECIDCTLCEPECPVEAIYSEDELPAGQEQFGRSAVADEARERPVGMSVGQDTALAGSLRVSTLDWIFEAHAGVFASFCQRYPAIELTVLATEAEVSPPQFIQ